MNEKNWRESLFYEQKNGYDLIDAEESKLVYAYCEGYKRFMDAARTEREAVKTGIELAEDEFDTHEYLDSLKLVRTAAFDQYFDEYKRKYAI